MSNKQAGLQTIDITQLPINQLNQLSQQLEQEIEFFTNSLNQLKLAQTKFHESHESLSKITPGNEHKDILVPLTSSMYVEGKLSNVENVIINIGTGYYVEMVAEKGKDYFKRKVDYLTKQIEKIQPLLQEKHKMKQATVEILQMKVQAQMASQQTAGTAK